MTAPGHEELDEGLVRELHAQAVDAGVRVATAAEAQRRVSNLLADEQRRPPMRLEYPRWGWRRAVRFAVERRMYTPEYLTLYRRHLWHRLDRLAHGQDVVFQGIVMTGKRVELHAKRGHGRLVLGPWAWIGNDNKLRAHEGQLTIGEKVVMGRDNVINTHLDIEIGATTIIADWCYICDFDHRFEDLNRPIKDQGIITSPVRVGQDVWVGEKASILRGVDIGRGSIIASSALVRSDVPPFSIVGGVPGRVLRSRLPDGMEPEEALDLIARGLPIPSDPLEG